MVQRKFGDDIDFAERLGEYAKSELQDWEELDNVSYYFGSPYELDSYVEDPYKGKTRDFKQQYGENRKNFTLDIYGDHISINDQVIETTK